MRPDLLNRFFNDEHTRNELIAFLHDFIGREALKRLYGKEDVSGMADAKQLIDLAFSELDNLYGIQSKANKPLNQAK